MDLSDLLQQVATGDRNALAQLYSCTGAQLLGVAVRMLQRRELAEEVLHEAFVRIWHNASNYSAPRGTPMSWMTAIVRNAALDQLRRRRREMPIDDLPGYETQADGSPDPFQRMVMTIEGRALADCLNQLDSVQRGCLLLAYY
jgi:RNA polymerase sigma-70 factor (ECF subfamily)